MSTLVRVTSDGRLYPPSWPHMPPEERQRLADLAHHLHCAGGLSVRQTQAAMAARGVRRSTGMIHKDLTRFECSQLFDHASTSSPARPAYEGQAGGMALDPSIESLVRISSDLLKAQDTIRRQRRQLWALAVALRAERQASLALVDLLDEMLASDA